MNAKRAMGQSSRPSKGSHTLKPIKYVNMQDRLLWSSLREIREMLAAEAGRSGSRHRQSVHETRRGVRTITSWFAAPRANGLRQL